MELRSVKNSLLNFFSNRTDIFGNGSIYQEFKTVETNQTSANGFNSSVIFGQIVYKDNAGDIHKSNPLVLKITPPVKNSKFISNSYINEMNFYTKIVPALSSTNASFSSLFPQFYHGEMIFNAEGDHAVLIFEDLQTSSYQMSKEKSFLDLDHLKLMMRKIGEFHAYSYKAKSTMPHVFYPMANNYLETNPIVNWEMRKILKNLVPRGFEYLIKQDSTYEKYATKIKAMFEVTDDILIEVISNDKKNPNSVICHGDYLRNNVMFRYENEVPTNMLLIDLATYRLASPAVDLVNVLYINTDQKTRDEYWDALIDEYYSALQTTFPENEIPSKDEILNEFTDRAFVAYIIASYFLPNLIVNDTEAPISELDLMISPENGEGGLHQVSKDALTEMALEIGGERGTKALSDVLRDMIDRRFIGH